MPSTRGRTSRSVVNMVSRDRSKAAWVAAGRTRKARKTLRNVLAGQAAQGRKVVAHHRQQILFLGRQRMHVVGVAAIGCFGGADQGRAVPRHDEHGAPVGGAFHIVNAGGQGMRNDDMRALHQIHVRYRNGGFDRTRHLRRPRPRRIDQHSRPAFNASPPATE